MGERLHQVLGPDRIKTLVSMATDSSHRVIMEKTVWPLFLSCFSSDPSDLHESLDEIKFWPDLTTGSMATDRVIMEKTAVCYPILFILAGKDDVGESSEEFKIGPDPTTDCGVSCP